MNKSGAKRTTRILPSSDDRVKAVHGKPMIPVDNEMPKRLEGELIASDTNHIFTREK